jgi:hypothetical protein
VEVEVEEEEEEEEERELACCILWQLHFHFPSLFQRNYTKE